MGEAGVGKSRLTYELVSFHTGDAVSAEAVKFSFERYEDIKLKGR